MAIFKIRVFFLFFFSFATACVTIRPLPDNFADLKLSTLQHEPFDLQNVVNQHQATVLIWWATQCPCVLRYQSRMEDLRRQYRDKNVAILAVSSNADDSVSKVQEISHSRNFNVPIIVDHQGQLASLLGAETTPTTVVIDQSGKVRFKGWIDNERKPGAPGRIAYLENALEQLLSQQTLTQPIAPTYGCMITKSLAAR